MLDATPEASLNDFIQKLSGIDKSFLLEQIENESYMDNWEQTARQFAKQRSQYLLYE